MRRLYFLIIILTILLKFTSCKVTESNIVGKYKMDNFPKTILNLKSDTTFEFIQNYRNPYLLPFEHPDEVYFRTTGLWTLQNNFLFLNSTNDSLTYKLYDIVATDTSKSQLCNYVFYDIYNEIVPILYVMTKKNGPISRFHSSIENFTYEKTEKENLQFFFFGYRPFTIMNSQNGETNYKIFLQPEFRPSWFKGTKFKVKRDKLKHLSKNIIFRK
jgi:hypothetical protein